MPGYGISIRPRARKALRQFPHEAQKDITDVIDALANDPRPDGVRALKGHRPWLRVRSGDYRVIYAVDDAARLVRVAVIGHRRDVYRNLDL